MHNSYNKKKNRAYKTNQNYNKIFFIFLWNYWPYGHYLDHEILALVDRKILK